MYWHRISELLMDWWIGQGLALHCHLVRKEQQIVQELKLDQHFGQGLVDWNRIGRMALIRHIGDGLTSNRQIGNELADAFCICIGLVDQPRINIGLVMNWKIEPGLALNEW